MVYTNGQGNSVFLSVNDLCHYSNTEVSEDTSGNSYLGLVARKPVLGGLRTTKAQTRLRIRAD